MLLNSNLNEDNSPLINQAQSVQSQSLITTDLEKDSLDPILKEKYERLQQTYNAFEWIYLACILCIQLSVICLFLYFTFDLTKSLILLFAFAAILALVALCNIYVKLKVMLDMIKESKNQLVSISIIVSYICINLGGICCLLYLALLSVKIYDDSFMTWSIISVPIYFTVCILILYSLFLLPVMLISKMRIEIILIFSSLFCVLTFLILLNSKLDSGSNDLTWTVLSIPVHLALIAYFAYISINYYYMTVQEQQLEKINLVLQLLSIFLFINSVAFHIIQLNNSGQLDYIPCTILLAGSLCFSTEKLIGLYATDEDDHSENSNTNKKL